MLVAGDMLSDILVPFLDRGAAEPIDDYLAALALFESMADTVDTVVPGHGSAGGNDEERQRLAQRRSGGSPERG